VIYLSGCKYFQSSTLICYLFERVNVCRDIILPSILNVCILLCAYVARFWGRRDTRDTGSFLVGERTVLLSVTQCFYVLGTPYCIRVYIETTKYVVNPFCDRTENFGSRQTAHCALSNDWPQRTLPSTRCIIVFMLLLLVKFGTVAI